MTKLRYSPEQVNLLDAQMEVWNACYSLSRQKSPWAMEVIEKVPLFIGDKWNSMCANLFEWCEYATAGEVEMFLSELNPGYVRMRVSEIIKGKQ